MHCGNEMIVFIDMPLSDILRFSCDQCDYETTKKGNLLTHLKSKHEGIKFPCDQCDYKATQKSRLTVHIKSIHEGVKL